MSDFEQRRSAIITMRRMGSPAASCAAWLSAVDKAERDGRPLPTWPELEAIARSVPLTIPPGMGGTYRINDGPDQHLEAGDVVPSDRDITAPSGG